MNRTWWHPRPTGDPSGDRHALSIHYGCVVVFCVFGLVIVRSLWRYGHVAAPIAIGELAAIAALALNYAGHWRWAARVGSYGVLLSVALLVTQARDGYRSITMMCFPAPLLIAVMLLRTRDYIILAVTTLATVTALGVAEIHGLIPLVPLMRTPTDYLTVFWVDLIVAAIAIFGGLLARDAHLTVADLRASKEQYGLLAHAMQSSGECIMIADKADQILFVNDAFLRTYGYAAGELVGQHTGILRSARRLPGNGDEGKAHAIHHDWNGELWSRAKDGSEFQVQQTTSTVLDEEGRKTAFVTIGRDITSQKSAEYMLRESEAKYRTLFESSSDAVLLTAPDGRVFSANAEACRIFGHTAAEICRLGRGQLVDPSDPRLPGLMEERDRTGRVLAELTFLRADGSRFPGELSSAVFPDREGRIRTSMIIRDITDRKRAEQQLLESNERFAKAFRSAPVLVAIASLADGTYVDINDYALAVSGFSREETIGKTSLGIKWIDPVSRNTLLEELKRNGRVAGLELPFTTKDGRTMIGVVYGEKIVVSGVECLLSVTVDITERKRAEAEREKLLGQLAQAQKLESIGRLAGGVAHDFNNLLTVINGYAAFLTSQLPESDPRREYALEIKMAGDRAADLTRQLLAFSRKQVSAPKVISLNAVIGDAERFLRRLLGDDVELHCSVGGEAPGDSGADSSMVLADPNQIHQVLMNLAVNARDAMPDGGRLGVCTDSVDLLPSDCAHPDATPGRYVCLTVSDTGTGMTGEVMGNIFEPFFTTKDPGAGTGLGLATVYGIVRQNDGWVEVESTPGEGSTFKVYLPRVFGEAHSEGGQAATQATLACNTTVLVVEDQPAVRRFTSRVLQCSGYTVLEAGNAEEAHAVVRRRTGKIDLLLTDVVMPGTGGHALAEELQREIEGLKVILMSGYSEETIAKRGVLPEGSAYLQKPFTPGNLAALVRQQLGLPPRLG